MNKSMLLKNVLIICGLVLSLTAIPGNAADLDQGVVSELNFSDVEPQISIAPLNPAFVQYMEELEQSQNAAPVNANTNTVTLSSLIPPESSANTSSPDISNIISFFEEGKLTDDPSHPTGFIPSPVDLSHLSPVNMQELMASEEYGFMSSDIRLTDMEVYPSRYDLRDNNGVTAVRDQGQAGSCWAHGSIGSLESYLLHNRSETWDFSENNAKNILVSSNQDGFDRADDDGGNNLMTAAYLTRWDGPVLESDDPYNDLSGVSPSNTTVAKHVQEIMILPGVNESDDLFKWMVTNYGAISVSMLYGNSYFNSENNSYYYYGEIVGTNHAVTLVGWDDNYSKHNFTPAAPGNGAFIIKNSWGDNWGEEGYFYISYYDNATGLDIGFNGLNTRPYARNFIFTSENVSNYDRVYQYDPLGWTECVGYDNSTAYGANVFTATTNETLKAVSFYTVDSNSFYNISIYLDPEAGPVNSSGPVSVKNGTTLIAGYHTIDFDTNVSLLAGQNFSVVVQFTTPNYNYPIAIEMPISDYSSNAHAETGQSYMSCNGTEWEDISESDKNICIKAFTTEEKEPEAAFVAGTKYVHVNETVDFHDASLFSPTTWEWDFGDNSTSSVQNPLHAYSNTGAYNISLNVSNSFGNDVSLKTSLIHVLDSTIIVNNSGSADFTTIDEAIDAASDGDTILIEPGTYSENLALTENNISLLSSTGNSEDVHIISPDSDEYTIHITADNVTISGVNVSGGYAGIYAYGSNGCNITNCYAMDNSMFGIYLYHSQNNTILNCTISNNTFYGLAVMSSANNYLANNLVAGNMFNYAFDDEISAVGTSNTINGKPIYYLVDRSDIVLDSSSNAGLVHLINCSNITVQDIDIENNHCGFFMYNCTDVSVSNFTAANNGYGMFLLSSGNNTIHSSNMSNNVFGVALSGSNDNLIYNNYLNNSASNALLSTGMSNQWNITMIAGTNIINGSYLGGNYWAKPAGTGWSQTQYSIGNGFCQPYEITNDGNNTDFLPLTANEEQPDEVVASASQNGNDGIHVRIPTSTSSPSNVAAMDSSVRFVGRDAEIQYVFTDRNTPVTDISFEADTNVGYVMATVNLLNELPENAPASTSVRTYQIMDIVLGDESFSSSGIGEATIGFAVSKEWITSNNYDKFDIRMEHFSDGVWNRLVTTEISEDDEYVYFEATTTGFSPFMICADVTNENMNAEIQSPDIIADSIPESTATDENIQDPANDEKGSTILILPVVILVGILGIVYWRKGSKGKI
ncbi:lectin like domain-containing protein [Methanolobus psychrotolerans]|uniref:lectin like domain-containing protein n=1 Tax=Methanolobus psychrotolerans TaxID=1874706 RepID=UPI000B91ACFC|nr:lectin like domain-containing protein [Methanolobus psychrotolerans]